MDEDRAQARKAEMHVSKTPGSVSCMVDHGPGATSVASADEIESGIWWVSRVKAHRDHQRMGHGKRLVSALKTACAELGADVVRVVPGGYDVPVEEQRAFYAACGFEPENEDGLMVWRPGGRDGSEPDHPPFKRLRGRVAIEVANCVHCERVVLAPISDICDCGAELGGITKLVPLAKSVRL